MIKEIQKKYKSIAIIYHIHDEGRQRRDCVGHVAPYAESITDNIDYFFTPDMEFPENQCLEKYDLVFIMGGLGQVFGDDIPEYMIREIAMITDAVHRRQKIIGICLGAQILALILGAEVSFNKNFECGFLPVTFNTNEGNPVLKDVPSSEIFWHWHECGFHAPESTIEIATSKASLVETYENENFKGSQGFVNEYLLGLQFHPELTSETYEFVKNRVNEDETLYKQSNTLTNMLAPIYTSPIDNEKDNCARTVFYNLMNNFLII